jgi:hypothetical protein
MSDPKEYRPFGSYGPEKSEDKSSSRKSDTDAESSENDPVSDDLNQPKEFEEEKREESRHSKHDYELDDQMRTVIRKMAGDMTFVAIFNLISGVFISLSIIGAVFGIPVIVHSIRMIQSGSNYKRFSRNGNVRQLYEAFLMQRKSFFIQKVVLIVIIVLFVLQIILIYLFFDMLVGDLMRTYSFPMS